MAQKQPTVNRSLALARICSALVLNACDVFSSSPIVVVLSLLPPRPSKARVSSPAAARSARRRSLIPALVSNPSHCVSEPLLMLDEFDSSLSRFSGFRLRRLGECGAIVGELDVGLGVLLLARFDLGVESSSPITLSGAPCEYPPYPV
jgi:hypothetical protein